MTSDDGKATCPQCGSPSIQAVPIERKKVGEAILAEYFLGTAAGVAAGASTVIQAVCLKCGCQWFPGTVQEKRIRAASGQLGEQAKQEEEARAAKATAEKATRDRNLAIGCVILVVVVIGLIVANLP
ncbi:MAG TPA: hypothetical protein VJN62_14370 [Gemmatimonadales bacterium]|nr:hypothetical protein [Gemmatimonadales bacterium]